MGRIQNEQSLHTEEQPELCQQGHGHWRVIRCAEDWDVEECMRCGAQRECPCSFDEEYA